MENAPGCALSSGARRPQQGGAQSGQRGQQAQQAREIRVRVLGRYQPAAFAAYGAAPDSKLMDVNNPGNATEFSMPALQPAR
jgi:hypothetical protein